MGILFQDTFTGADGTALPSHTPDIDVVGGGWHAVAGTPQISGGKMIGTTAGDDNIAYAETGVADVILTAVYVHGTHTFPLLYFRRSSSQSWILYWSPNHWIVQEVPGFATRDDEPDTLTVGNTYVLQLVLNGQQLDFYRDGTRFLTYGTATYNMTATQHGLDLVGSGGAPSGTFDDFSVVTAASSSVGLVGSGLCGRSPLLSGGVLLG